MYIYIYTYIPRGAITQPNFYMKPNLKLRFTSFLVKYLAGFAEIILNVSRLGYKFMKFGLVV